MYWLALHFPDLPLEIHTRGTPDPGPLAVTGPGRERPILRCNAPAAALGVRPGLAAAAALALAGNLRLLDQRPALEQAALERAAAWAGRFTSQVSLAPPHALLLEVGRSLRLFGGIEGLMPTLTRELDALGYRNRQGLAPTPEAALLLAGRGGPAAGPDHGSLRAALAQLGLEWLPLDPRVRETLHQMGLRTLGDLLRLPREGIATRLGPGTLRWLDRLLGDAPDPRPLYHPPPRFDARLELPAEVWETDALLFAARRLLAELGGFLLGRGAGTQRLLWELHHADGQCSRVTLGLARPERDPARFMELLRERLERVTLPQPVRELRLRVRDVQPLPPETRPLFADADGALAETGGRLLDRLRARLGAGAVTGLEPVADHRPERAWRRCPATAGGFGPGRERRPLWLLPEPLPLDEQAGRPWHRGRPLALDGERERIEAGWWEGTDIARDYFVAVPEDGGRLWVYRELRGGGWFLHGVFE